MKRKCSIILCFVICLLLSGCGQTKEQKACSHEWYIVEEYTSAASKRPFRKVHCPKCGYTTDFNETQWKIYQIDKEYRDGTIDDNDLSSELKENQ